MYSPTDRTVGIDSHAVRKVGINSHAVRKVGINCYVVGKVRINPPMQKKEEETVLLTGKWNKQSY